MGAGGWLHHQLARLRASYPLSLHGVGLSIGAEAGLDKTHLAALKNLCERYEPARFSEHLAWSTHDDHYLNDLLPVPYTRTVQQRVIDHIHEVQDTLQRTMLLENPSTYVLFEASEMDEISFIKGIAKATGCGLLLDVNNVMVSCTNHAMDPMAYLNAFPVEHVDEIHLAGYDEVTEEGQPRFLIDAHGSRVDPSVWALYTATLERCGPVATLIEWDNDVPDMPTLLEEMQTAEAALQHQRSQAARKDKRASHA